MKPVVVKKLTTCPRFDHGIEWLDISKRNHRVFDDHLIGKRCFHSTLRRC